MYQPDKLSPDVTVPLNDVQKALVEARALIERGWCQNTAHDDMGNHCMLGAVGFVTDHISGSYMFNVVRQVCDAVGGDAAAVVAWNDDPSRTKAEVLNAFDRAIEIAGRE
jgi:hypothetical protein